MELATALPVSWTERAVQNFATYLSGQSELPWSRYTPGLATATPSAAMFGKTRSSKPLCFAAAIPHFLASTSERTSAIRSTCCGCFLSQSRSDCLRSSIHRPSYLRSCRMIAGRMVDSPQACELTSHPRGESLPTSADALSVTTRRASPGCRCRAARRRCWSARRPLR